MVVSRGILPRQSEMFRKCVCPNREIFRNLIDSLELTLQRLLMINFSFSGLKTQILYFVQKNVAQNPDFVKENLDDICASIQHTIINILMDKLKLAVKQTGIKQIAIGGGVSANSGIRDTLMEDEQKYGWKCFVPKFEYTTDNAAMIGVVGYHKFLEQMFDDDSVVSKPRIAF